MASSDNTWTKPFTSAAGQAASYFNDGSSKKGSYSSLPNPEAYTSSSTPLQQPGHYSKPPSMSLTRHRKTFTRFKRYLRFITIFSVVATTLLSGFLTGTYVYIVYHWSNTRREMAHDGSRPSPWARGSIVWPTYVMLGASVITFLMSAAMLVAVFFRGRKKTFFSVFYNVFFIVVWIVVAVLFRVFKDRRDLWGWTCHPQARRIQAVYVGVVDFNFLCDLQSASWNVAVALAAVLIFCTTVGYWFNVRSNRAKRAIVNELGDAGLEDLL